MEGHVKITVFSNLIDEGPVNPKTPFLRWQKCDSCFISWQVVKYERLYTFLLK